MPTSRRRQHPRCPECRMHLELCICDLCPHLDTDTHVLLVMHQLEARKTTNTGRLLSRCLNNSGTVIRGAGNAPDAPIPVPEGHQALVLYPSEDSKPITEFAESQPICLIALDGTWSQAARTRRRMAGIAELPHAHLPDTSNSAYRLRSADDADRLSTLEAVARALALLEPRGDEVRRNLETIFRVMVDRTLYSNGRITAAEVTGGVPKPK